MSLFSLAPATANPESDKYEKQDSSSSYSDYPWDTEFAVDIVRSDGDLDIVRYYSGFQEIHRKDCNHNLLIKAVKSERNNAK